MLELNIELMNQKGLFSSTFVTIYSSSIDC